MSDDSLAGRRVLVFGAAGALGAGVAEAFRAAGAEVTGVDRAEPPAARRLDGVRYAAADVLDDAALGALFDAAAPPWAVVNTVGGFAGAPAAGRAGRGRADRPARAEPGQRGTDHQARAAASCSPPARAGSCTPPAGPAWSARARGSPTRSASSASCTWSPWRPRDAGHRHHGELRRAQHHRHPGQPGGDAGRPARGLAQDPDIARSYLYLAGPGAALVNGAAVPV